MAIKNIIFDWSGVISDDIKTVYETTMRTFERLGAKRISYRKYRAVFELPYMKFYNKFLDAKPEVLEKIYSEESEHVPLPCVYPEAKKALEKLNSMGLHLTVFSSMSTKRFVNEAKKYGVLRLFTRPRTAVRDKVAAFDEFINENGYNKSETIYVGDMVHDIHAARKAGIRIVSIARGYDTPDKLVREKPDYLIMNLKQLIPIIERENCSEKEKTTKNTKIRDSFK